MCVVWANAYQSHLEKIYKLQEKLVRIITFKEYNHSSKRSNQKLHRSKQTAENEALVFEEVDRWSYLQQLSSYLKSIQYQSTFKRTFS